MNVATRRSLRRMCVLLQGPWHLVSRYRCPARQNIDMSYGLIANDKIIAPLPPHRRASAREWKF